VFARTRSVLDALLVLFLTTPVFNNPGYTVAGVDPGQFAGVLASALFGLTCIAQPRVRFHVIPIVLLAFWAVATVQAAIVVLASPELADYAPSRGVILGKIAVLALVLMAFYHRADSRLVRTLLAAQVGVCLAACAIYWFQVAFFLSGTVPYGTYLDAGFTGVPSFGSVSIERGHFGKLLVPTLPLLLLYSLYTGKRWPLAIVVFTSLINFSASALFFLVGYAVLYSLLWRESLLKLRRLAPIFVFAVLVITLAVSFSAQYGGVIDKIRYFNNAENGRTLDLIADYLDAYPLGISYGGSTLRTAPRMQEVNMGAYAWATQFAFLSVPLLMLLMWGHVRSWYSSRAWLSLPERRILLGGMLMIWVIGAIDVLWFMPTLWLLPVLGAVLARSAQGDAKIARPYAVGVTST
jgi:hypothetical protein